MCKEEEIGGKYCNNDVLNMLKNLESKKDKPENSLWKGLEKFRKIDN
jgi:hypothetical protein